MESLLRTIERIIPRPLYRFFQPAYHFLLALLGAVYYRFPSRQIAVIFVTGTKGKSSVVEILNSILEAAGEKTAVLGTIRFKIDRRSERNLRKMTIPGRFFIQQFLRQAVTAGCTYAIIEMTSEGAKQSRHRFIALDMLIFTNFSPEHIESHGSIEKYRDAKLSIGRALARSGKPHRYMVANADDTVGRMFLDLPGVDKVPYGAKDGEPILATASSAEIIFHGQRLVTPLPGRHNALNMIAAARAATCLGISLDMIAKGLSSIACIPGRGERVLAGQGFPVVVDYAHTRESLEALYTAYHGSATVCVLGNTGGGRDHWKRPVMARIAGEHCAHIILTNEDPYDEDPRAILQEMEAGLQGNTETPHEIILDRREAIRHAVEIAEKLHSNGKDTAVLITGKGTDPFIMGPKGTKEKWDDRDVAREEIMKVLGRYGVSV